MLDAPRPASVDSVPVSDLGDLALPPFAEAIVRERPGLAKLVRVAAQAAAEHGDASHDLAHALRVARWTVRLGQASNDLSTDDLSANEPSVDPGEALAAALLHDAVHIPKDSPDRSLASTRSAELARPLLREAGFDEEAAERVASAIQTHSFSYCARTGAAPTSPLGDALQDADRLEALGAMGLYRCLATGVQMGAELFHADDPFAEARALDDRAFSVDHFYTKLLGLPETMRTAAGREEARRRARILEIFAAELRHELELD